ncbi:FxsA family protein [Desulfovibrio sp. OttesenSCG-928-A18]|nr:FxsA family protein [Desulfovibrio sp. OttesenSCG-928-A18]
MAKLLLFLAFPAVELYLLFKVGSIVGASYMVLWVFASAFLGWGVMRSRRRSPMLDPLEGLGRGEPPQNMIAERLVFFLAGALLILPGLITDGLGLLLLIPPVRGRVAAFLGRRVAQQQGGASRMFIFGSGAGFGNGFGRKGDFDPFAFSRARDPFDGQDREEATSPRYATIIDSTAIEVRTEAGSDGNGGVSDSDGPGHTEASGSEDGAGDSGAKGKPAAGRDTS